MDLLSITRKSVDVHPLAGLVTVSVYVATELITGLSLFCPEINELAADEAQLNETFGVGEVP